MGIIHKKYNNLKHEIMKTRTIIAAMFAALLPITTCGAQTVIQLGDNTMYNYGDATYDYEDDGPTIERNLDLKNFKAIENSYSAKICYTHGNQYGVKVVGSQKAIDVMDFRVENGTLYISINKSFKGKSLNIQRGVTLYISSPELESVSNRGSLSLEGDSWKLNKLSVSNRGSLNIRINALDCQSLNIDNAGSFQYATGGKVKADNVSISNRGSSDINLSFTVKDAFEISNRGSSNLEGKVKASSYSESCLGSTNDKMDIVSEKMDLDVKGSADINSTFKGKTASISGYGAGTINMTVDCDKISVDAAGITQVTVKGTAGDTSFYSRSQAKIDASGLTKK